MVQGPLLDCPRCQELIKAADEAHRLEKEAVLSRRQASGRTYASCSVGDDDPNIQPLRLALRTLLLHVQQHIKS
jgi:hypothetical protein